MDIDFNIMIEQKENIDTANQLHKYLRGVCGFDIPSEDERKKWGYKNDLFISPKFLIGRALYENKTDRFLGVVKNYDLDYRKSKSCFRMETEKGYCFLTNTYIKFNHPETGEEIKQPLHPTRNGLKLWSRGYYISEKEYKSLYYTTREYREKIEGSLEVKYGISGLTSPFQVKEVQEKASQSIFEKYGVRSFLERGSHYSAVTISMIEKYGVENLFNDLGWQKEIREKYNGGFFQKDSAISSSIEKDFIFELVRDLNLNECYYDYSDKGQYWITSKKSKNSKTGGRNYSLDFYDPKENIAIEVYGDFWHCNPEIYESEFIHPFKKKTAKEIWKEDEQRVNEIVSKINCKFVIVWEREIKRDIESVVNRIKKEYGKD